MKLRLAVLFVSAVALVVAVAGPAYAHDCSSDADCEQTGGYNGAIALVGGVAAVAAAAAAAAAHTPKDEDTDLSILQLDVNKLDVDGTTPGIVTLTGWHAGNDGEPKRVPMTIWIDGHANGGVLVQPDQGEGQLVATITVDENNPGDADQVLLTAHGVWKGNEATETITVRLGGDLELRLY